MRYLPFARVSVLVNEPTYLMSLFWDQSVRSPASFKAVQDMLVGFKEAGKQTEITTRSV